MMNINEWEKTLFSKLDAGVFCKLVTEYGEWLDPSIASEANNAHKEYVKDLLPMRTFLSHTEYDSVEVSIKNDAQDKEHVDAMIYRGDCNTKVQITLAFKDMGKTAFLEQRVLDKGCPLDAEYFKDITKLRQHFKKRHPEIKWDDRHIEHYEEYGYYIEEREGQVEYRYEKERYLTESDDEIANQVVERINKKRKDLKQGDILLIGINDFLVKVDERKRELAELLTSNIAKISDINFDIYIVGITHPDPKKCFFQHIAILRIYG